MPHPVTLKELARLLHLSPSTVSKALKGHPDISKATQEKVRELAKQKHYLPHALAKSLRDRKSHLIALVLPTLNDYFFIQSLEGVLEFAFLQNYKVIVYNTQEQYEKEAEICNSLIKSGIDGLLIAPALSTRDTAHLETLRQEDLPLVFLKRIAGDIEADRVLEDDFHSARLAVSHLIKTGCKHIAHFSAPQKWLWAQKRKLGYIQSLREHHLIVNENLIIENYPEKQLKPLIENLLVQYHIDGIFAISDEVAIKMMLILQKAGYSIPGDVAICGFGNIPAGRVVSPQLTTVGNCGRESGKIAAELLLNRIEKKISGETQTKILRNQLIVRQSTY